MQEFQTRQTGFQRLCQGWAAGCQILGIQPGTGFQIGQELFENADDFAGRLERVFHRHDVIHKSSSACRSRRS